MAKRTTKRASRRSYDEDEFNEDELKEELEEEEEDEFDDDYDSDEDEEEDEEDEDEERPARRSSRKKTASKQHVSEPAPNKEVRLKAFWAVYSQNYQRVEVFDYADKKKAQARAAELTESKKMLHFVKLDKKVIES